MRDQVIIKMTKCDNLKCSMAGHPENLKPYRPPYGWLSVKGGFMGCGPDFAVEVCSLACLEPAIRDALDEEAR